MPSLNDVVARLDTFVDHAMQLYNTPGLALALTDREHLLGVLVYGYADLARGVPVTADTLFETGSDGKAFTALALLQEAEHGHIDLHAPVDRYLPWFAVPSPAAPVSAHHLLSHTAGLITGTDFAPDGRAEVWALRAIGAASPPGQHFHYSNVGYKVLGYLLEWIAGAAYGTIIQQRILDPLGMAMTEPVITHETRARLAIGYQPCYDDRPPHRTHALVPAPWLETDTGDGCLVSTVGDMACYVRLLLNAGQGPHGRLISAESFALMTYPHSAIGPGVAYGYGLEMLEVDGHPYLMHGGDMPGFNSTWRADRRAGLAAIALMNGPCPPGIPAYAVQLLRALQEGRPLPDPALPDPTAVAGAADYAGIYRAGERTLTIDVHGNHVLLAQDGERIALEGRGDDTFYVPHSAWTRFLLRFGRCAGQVVEAVHGPDWYISAHHNGPSPRAHPAEWTAYVGHYRAHNPWRTNFRIVLRQGTLLLIEPVGEEEPLTELSPGFFRVGTDGDSPERLRFDTVVDGSALRAQASGCAYYRFFAP